MAKFKLKASLVPKLTERNVISPTTGKIKMRVPWKQNRITGEKCYEIEFLPTDVIETTNEFSAAVFRVKRSAAIRVGTEWYIADPSVLWFDELLDGTTPTLVLESHGVEVLKRRDRKVLNRYAREVDVVLPTPVENNLSNRALLQAARNHLSSNR